jgi:hypothetical protein
MNVRILARWEDDPLESAITLDARLDASGARIAGGEILFGATGLGGPDARPFTLDADGVMDFGAGRPQADRYWRCDIRTREIRRGAIFEVTWSGGERGRYRIEKVAQPGSRA